MTATNVLAVLLAATFGVHGALMIFAAPMMRAAAASVGFSVTQYRYIGLLEVAAAIGLVASLAIPILGMAAGVGLLVLMSAAVTVHYRVAAHGSRDRPGRGCDHLYCAPLGAVTVPGAVIACPASRGL
jgi:hypothetical protein